MIYRCQDPISDEILNLCPVCRDRWAEDGIIKLLTNFMSRKVPRFEKTDRSDDEANR